MKEIIRFRLSEKDKQIIQHYAETNDMSVSKFIRKAVFMYIRILNNNGCNN